MLPIVGNMNAPEKSTKFRVMHKSIDLIEEINDPLILLENDDLDIPVKLKDIHAELAFETMNLYYDAVADDLNDITELEQWIKATREEL